MNAAAIILAGGASTRMGTPKAALTYDGESFVDRLARIFEPAAAEIVVVVGRHAREIRAATRRPVHFVVNAEWELGQLSSLQCGLSVLPPEIRAVFFTPVDYPLIAPETPPRLLAALSGGATFAIPTFEGRHGHPVLFRSQVIAEFFALGAGGSARDVVHRHRESAVYVDAGDPGILRDVDEPADYAALPQSS